MRRPLLPILALAAAILPAAAQAQRGPCPSSVTATYHSESLARPTGMSQVFNLNTHSYVALITNQGRVGISYRIMLDRTTLPQRIVSQGISGNWRMGETGRLWPGETRRVVVDTGPGELSAREISDSIMLLCRVLD